MQRFCTFISCFIGIADTRTIPPTSASETIAHVTELFEIHTGEAPFLHTQISLSFYSSFVLSSENRKIKRTCNMQGHFHSCPSYGWNRNAESSGRDSRKPLRRFSRRWQSHSQGLGLGEESIIKFVIM